MSNDATPGPTPDPNSIVPTGPPPFSGVVTPEHIQNAAPLWDGIIQKNPKWGNLPANSRNEISQLAPGDKAALYHVYKLAVAAADRDNTDFADRVAGRSLVAVLAARGEERGAGCQNPIVAGR
jgi:hypothetical protein